MKDSLRGRLVSYVEQQPTRTAQRGKQVSGVGYKRDYEIMSPCHSFGLNWQCEDYKCSDTKTLSHRYINVQEGRDSSVLQGWHLGQVGRHKGAQCGPGARLWGPLGSLCRVSLRLSSRSLPAWLQSLSVIGQGREYLLLISSFRYLQQLKQAATVTGAHCLPLLKFLWCSLRDWNIN